MIWLEQSEIKALSFTGAPLYWGNSIALTGSGHDFTAKGKDLVFDGNSLSLTLGASSTFNAHS